MDKNELLLEQWKLASELHTHEDELTWSKLQYFVAINSIMLSALAVVWSEPTQGSGILYLSLIVTVFGVLIAITWLLIFQRAQLYHKYRIYQARSAERELKVDGEQVLDLYQLGIKDQRLIEDSPWWIIGKHISAQTLIWLLVLVTLLGWLVACMILGYRIWSISP